MRISVRNATLMLALFAIAFSTIGFAYAIQFAPGDADGLGAYAPQAIVRLFDLDTEGNIPTWFEAALLLAAAGLCGLFAATRPAGAVAWRALTAALVVMSCDEVAGLHEFVGRFIAARLDTERLDVYNWLLPGALLALLIVVFARRASAALDPPVRRLVALAGVLFFTGALGLEVVEAFVDGRLYGTSTFGLLAWTEETLELAGVVVFLHAMMVQLRDRSTTLVFAAVH